MNKEIKFIEVIIMGHNSILGYIFKEYGYETVENRNKYYWMIMVNPSSFGMAEDECKKLGLKTYTIFDRASAICKNDK